MNDLKAIFYCTLIALIATPIVYQLLFADFGWWMQ